MSKLDHAASFTSSDAASTQKATLQQRTSNRKPINTGYNVLFLRRKVARPRRPLLQVAACTDATPHPRRGHHRTNARTSCSARSPDNRTAHRWATLPSTSAPDPRSLLLSLRSTPRAAILRFSGLTGEMKAFDVTAASASRPETQKVMPFLDGHQQITTMLQRDPQAVTLVQQSLATMGGGGDAGELEVPTFWYAKIRILWNIPLPVRIAAKRFRWCWTYPCASKLT